MSKKNTLLKYNGGYSLPYLIYLHDVDETIQMYFCNNNSDIVYNNVTYSAGTFSYTPKASSYGFDGGGSLEISVTGNQVIDLVESYRNLVLEVIGAINENGTITKINGFKHKYCTATGNRRTITLDFEADERINMTFPTLIFNNQNNKGN